MKNSLRILFVLSFVGIAATSFATSRLEYERTQTFQVQGFAVNNSHSEPQYEHVQTQDEPNKSFAISFDFQTHALGTPPYIYQNVFQTAPLNTGLRLEISPTGVLAMVSGEKPPQGAPHVLTGSLTPAAWHHFRMNVDVLGNLDMQLDNEAVVKQSDPPIQYVLSDIVIGNGFSKTRPLNGEIKNIQLQYSFFNDHRDRMMLMSFLRIFCILAGPVLLYLMSGPEDIKSRERFESN
jgi:hypothetical protein